MMKNIHLLLIVAFSALTMCSNAIAQSVEQQFQYTLSSEQQLQNKQHFEKIESFYDTGKEGTLSGKAEIPIYFKLFRQTENEKGAIVLSTGRTEGAVKYKELIYDLYANGYSVYIHDHRGQGLSGRMADDSEMGHVDDFQYYIDDMKLFYEECVKPAGHDKIYLLAHSMGGTIGMSYLEQHPEDFSAAAFSSPMLGLSAYICPLAKILSGKTPKYAPGQTGYSDDSTKFEGNSVTGSEIRYHIKIAAYQKVPAARVGGPSVQWLNESCKQLKQIFKNVKAIQTPFIIFTAENETVVIPKANQKFIQKAQKLNKECREYFVKDAQHELLMEKDAQREEVLMKVFGFFNEQ